MFGPRTHAHPTELILALLASHVIAATIFLNGALTLAALLGVTFDPVRSLTVIATFLQPHPSDGA
jgi:hypothetical protein